MNMISRPLAALACLAALALGANAAHAQATPKRGGSAVIGVSVAGPTLNTQLTSNVTPLIIADLWADGLYKYDKTGGKKPQLASSWDISADGKVYTFHLRPNLNWSDGHTFSSEDVAFTLNAFAKFNTYLVKVLPNIDRAETPDANTFVVHLKEPQSSALEGFDKEVFPLMPAEHIADIRDIRQRLDRCSEYLVLLGIGHHDLAHPLLSQKTDGTDPSLIRPEAEDGHFFSL